MEKFSLAAGRECGRNGTAKLKRAVADVGWIVLRLESLWVADDGGGASGGALLGAGVAVGGLVTRTRGRRSRVAAVVADCRRGRGSLLLLRIVAVVAGRGWC
jgi:hypothetical protein